MKAITSLFTLAAMVVAFQANAAGRTPAAAKSSAATTSDYGSSDHKHIISPSLGFMGPGANRLDDGTNNNSFMLSGLFGIGAEYEYMWKPDVSFGGFLRYYNTSDSLNSGGNGVTVTETAFLIGGLAHAYLIDTATWQGYVASGLTLLNLTDKVGSTSISPNMAFGIPLVVGLGYKINDQFTLGIEHMQVLALGSNVNGWPISDFMVRLRIGL